MASEYPKIFLVRHGQTIWNREGRFQGRLDSALTERGEAQALENAKKLKKYIDKKNIKVFSSPLGRAKNTAFIICDELGIDRESIIFDNRVIEFSYGVFEGKRKEDIKNSKEFRDREANKWDYRIENGESYALVQKRVKEFLEEIRGEREVLIVAHEMVNRTIRGVYCNYTKEETLKLKQPNDTIFLLYKGMESLIN